MAHHERVTASSERRKPSGQDFQFLRLLEKFGPHLSFSLQVRRSTHVLLEVMQQRLFSDILRNQYNSAIFERWQAIGLPDCWLVAGCLFQTIWNLHSGHPPDAHIKDYDLFYFDGQDLSDEAETAAQNHIDSLFDDLGVKIEVSNQARVHVWYESYFGQPYQSLKSTKDGIDHFLVKETCIGARPGEVYAPNGIASLYKGQLSSNPAMPHRELFEAKAASYVKRWPWLKIIEAKANGNVAGDEGPKTL